MYQYFAKDGTKTEDCTEAKTLRRIGSTAPPLRLVWDDAPSADELYERLVTLLSPVAGDEGMTVLSKEQLFTGQYDPAVIERPFIVRVGGEVGEEMGDEAGNAEAQVAEWLATPNPSLDGDRPGDLLRGDASGRCRLSYIIAELEQGTFS